MWKCLAIVFCLIVPNLAAQAPVDIRGLSRNWTELGQPVGRGLLLNLDAGSVTVLPSEDGQVRVRYTGTGDHDLTRVRLRFSPADSPAELRLSHSLHNNFGVEIQVPRASALTLRMSAGEVLIQGVEGDKDLRVHAGQITVRVGDPSAYGPVSAAVWAGEVRPGPFGEAKEGLFRRFSYGGPGRYSLAAKVKAGEVIFQQ